jgi:hypothetical protein
VVTGSLETTNVLLGIMAGVSVLQALVLIGAGVMAYRLYGSALKTIRELEERQVAPLAASARAILADVQDVTARVRHETERVDLALRGSLDRVDETARVVRSRVREKTSRALWAFRRLRRVVEAVLSRDEPSRSAAASRV